MIIFSSGFLSICIYVCACFCVFVLIIPCIDYQYKDKQGQGQRETFFRIASEQAVKLGLIYEYIFTIYLKICNVSATGKEKRGEGNVKECFYSTLL